MKEDEANNGRREKSVGLSRALRWRWKTFDGDKVANLAFCKTFIGVRKLETSVGFVAFLWLCLIGLGDRAAGHYENSWYFYGERQCCLSERHLRQAQGIPTPLWKPLLLITRIVSIEWYAKSTVLSQLV